MPSTEEEIIMRREPTLFESLAVVCVIATLMLGQVSGSTGILRMHYLMKNASSDLLEANTPPRKVIPLYFGSPKESIKLAASLADAHRPNRCSFTEAKTPGNRGPPRDLSSQFPDCEMSCAKPPFSLPSFSPLGTSFQVYLNFTGPLYLPPSYRKRGSYAASALRATGSYKASFTPAVTTAVDSLIGLNHGLSNAVGVQAYPVFDGPVAMTSCVYCNVSANLPRDFCPMRVEAFILAEEEEISRDVQFAIREFIPPRPVFINERVELVQTFLFRPFDDTLFKILIRQFRLYIGEISTFECLVPGLFGPERPISQRDLIHWSEALFLYYKRLAVRFAYFVGSMLLHFFRNIIVLGPICCFVSPFYGFFCLFQWIFSFVLAYCPSFSNLSIFLSYAVSLRFFFAGTSAIPLFGILCYHLVRDFVIYGCMPDFVDEDLERLRRQVFFILSRKGNIHEQLFFAYRFLEKQHRCRWALPRISLVKTKYFYSPSIRFGKKLCTTMNCYKSMYDSMWRALELKTNLVPTAGESDSVPLVSDRWKCVGTTFQLVTVLCANLPFGLGFHLNPVAGQYIQDAILFVIKYLYIVTDTRSSKQIALACELLQFRNCPLGIALYGAANEWLGDYVAATLEEFDKIIDGKVMEVDEYLDPMGSGKRKWWHKGVQQPALSSVPSPRPSARNTMPARAARTMSNLSSIPEINPDTLVPTAGFVSMDSFVKLLNCFDGAIRSQVAKKILQVLAIIIALFSFSKSGTFSPEGMTRVLESMKTSHFDEAVDLMSYFLSLLRWLADAGWFLFRFPSSASSLLTPDLTMSWKDRAERLLLVEKCPGYANCTGDGTLDLEGKQVPLPLLRQRLLQLIKIEWPSVEAALKVTSSKFAMNEFKQLKNRLVTFESVLAKKIMSQKYRRQPFGIALTGGTSVGKSNVSNLLFAYISALEGMEHTAELVFSRNPLTVFWDTFIGQPYILFDDVGAIHPQSKTPDTSLVDILQVSNNAPYVPPMAIADEKGTQCVTSIAVIATSNMFDLNAHTIFSFPAAVYRRFHVWTVMSVKPAFADQSGRLDAGKIRRFWDIVAATPGMGDGEYNEQFPPYWNFTIHETGDVINPTPFLVFNTDSSLRDYLAYVKDEFDKHTKAQKRVMEAHTGAKKLDLCEFCKLPFCLGVCQPAMDALLRPRFPAPAPVAAVPNPVIPVQPATWASRLLGAGQLVPTALTDPVLIEDIDDASAVEEEEKKRQKEAVQAVDNYSLLVGGVLFSLCWSILHYFGYIDYYRICYYMICHFFYHLFWLFAALFLLVSLCKQWFITTRDACSVTDSFYLPYWMFSRLCSGAYSSICDFSVFFGIFAWGGFTRTAFLRACLSRVKRKIKSVATGKNTILLLLIVVLITMARSPAMKMLSTTLISTGGDEEKSSATAPLAPMDVPVSEAPKVIPDSFVLPGEKAKPAIDETVVKPPVPIPEGFKLPGVGAQPATQEDSRSAWYNADPPMDTRTDSSRCLAGGSGMTFMENNIRRNTCNLKIVRPGMADSYLKGLAIGGNMVLTCAHAFYDYSTKSTKRVATSGVAIFPSSVDGKAIQASFSISDSNLLMNVEEDWALVIIPSMTSRRSLVDYFVEKNHFFKKRKVTLTDGRQVDVCVGAAHLVSPAGTNNFQNWVERVSSFGPDFPPGYMNCPSFFGRAEGESPQGMSGSTFVSSSSGVCILGIQTMADKDDFSLVLTTFIGRTQLKDAINKLSKKSKLNQFSDVPRDFVVDENQQYPSVTATPTRSCPLLFPGLEQWNFQFMMTLQQAVGSPSSKFAHPPYRSFFRERGYICDKEKPVFDWKSKRNYLTQISKISSEIDVDRVDKISTVLSDHWIKAYGSELKLLSTLSLADAINGNDKVTWVERLKMDTSAGYPWNTRKSDLLEVRPVPVEVRASGYEYFLTDEMQQQFCRYFLCLIEKCPLNYPYKGTQKDEPISPEKNQTRGPRMFCAANLYVILGGRMLFGSYIRIAQRNPFISWAAVGMNCSSKIWGLLWRFITIFGEDRLIAGDYSNFDQNMSPVFTSAAYAVIISLLEASGNYSEEELQACRSWAAEAIYPTVIIDGDIYSIAGTNPSGNPLTVHVNCIVNILFIMYVWVGVGNDVSVFFVQIRMMTYGDDNLIAVHTSVTNFDFWAIHVQLATIGVKYTPADKSEPKPDRKFDVHEDVGFLKRLFVERGGYVFAPLDISSISKTFNCWMASHETDMDHGLSTFVSIWENACHYDDVQCARVHKDILDYCEVAGWPTDKFHPRQQIRDRFVDADVARFDTLFRQARLTQTSGSHYVTYNAEWPNVFNAANREFMYHGLTFIRRTITDGFLRWVSIQESAWVYFMRRIPEDQPAGAGVVPLLDNRFIDSDEPDNVGAFDGFYFIDGPEGGDDESPLPSGPS
jgi:hypothetical protein